MSPDKVHTVTMAAAILVTTGLGPRSAIEEAATLYDLAVERVRASGPTSTERPVCTCHIGYPNGGAPLNRPVDCAKHG